VCKDRAVARASGPGSASPSFKWAQALRFVIVGCINTLTCLIVILSLRYGAGAGDIMANALGYVVAIAVSFVLNRRFTFKHEGPVTSALLRFLTSFGIAYTANLLVLLVLLHQLDLPPYAAHPVANAVYTLFFFFLAKHFAFRDSR